MNTRGNATKKNVQNILMHLRKYVTYVCVFFTSIQMPIIRCLQHPYLYDDEIEPRGLPSKETHEKLIDASAKLRLLRALLPKLKARGHRVLLFSQVITKKVL